MRLKRLATAAVCIAALGGAAAAAPAAAKNDKPKHCNPHSHHRFVCDTDDGGTVTTECPAGFQLTDAFLAPAGVDLNGNLIVCTSGPFAVDDTPVL